MKKTFFDLWDNILPIVLLNLGFIVSLLIPVFLPGRFPGQFSGLLVLAAGIVWCLIYLAAAAFSVRAISDYGSFGFADFVRNLKAGLPAALCMSVAALFFWVLIAVIIPFYFALNAAIGLFLAALIFWPLVLAFLSLQFFFAAWYRLGTRPFKVFKKCCIIFFDNPGFVLFSLLYNIVMLAVSVLLLPLLLFLGPASVLLYLDEALRLRLLKYDWLEANPEPGSRYRKIPWEKVLAEEREKTGIRSFKNFIFPWKE